MREVDNHHSRRVRFYPFELDFNTGELSKHKQRIRLQPQPLLILRALLAKPGEIVTREELHEQIWPGNVFVDFEHSLNRSTNKLRRALGDTVTKPRFIETVHGRGYRFIAPVEDGSLHREGRIAVLPVENVTARRDCDDLAEGITEALIDDLGRALGQRLRVVSLATALRYKNKRIKVARIAAELKADYLVCGRLHSEDGRFRLRLELVDPRDRTARWAESFRFGRESREAARNQITRRITDSIYSELGPPDQLALNLVDK